MRISEPVPVPPPHPNPLPASGAREQPARSKPLALPGLDPGIAGRGRDPRAAWEGEGLAQREPT
jgi:hypothetical protein